MTNKINHLAVWVLVIVHQLVGWGWYTIFGEKWLNLHARTMTDIERTHSVGAYVLAIVTAIIVNYTLAWLIARVNATYAIAGLKVAPPPGLPFFSSNTRPSPCSPPSKRTSGRSS